jgi:Zn-dependent protease with chaperone function
VTALLVVLTLVLAAAAAVPVAVLPLVSRIRPSTVVPLLAAGSLVSAASVGVVLGLLALAVLGRIPLVADLGGWSADTLEVAVPVPPAVGVVAAGIAGVLIGRTLWRAGRILLLLGRSEQLCRRLRGGGGGGPIVIVDDDAADAFTLAGLRGCVVISRSLLQALGPAEQRMLTGHELSHLRCRHHLYVHAVDLAVAANPLLRKACSAVRLGVERWADEDAALCTGDRVAAASALARIALIRSSLRRGAVRPNGPGVPVLGAVASHITDRATALLAPAPRGTAMTATVTILLIATFVATVASTLQIHSGFELAEMAWWTANR